MIRYLILNLLTCVSFFLLDAADSTQTRGDELGIQRRELLKLAPFRFEYRVRSHRVFKGEKQKEFPERTGVVLVSKNGFFIFSEQSIAYDGRREKVSAWDGMNLYASPAAENRMWYLKKDDFFASQGGVVARDVPYVDLFKSINRGDGGNRISRMGRGPKVSTFAIFDYMALFDMYCTSVAGKYPPSRWCDIASDELFAKSCSLVSGFKERENECAIVFHNKGQDVRRGACYFMQMRLKKNGNETKVMELVHRGPWRSFVGQEAGQDAGAVYDISTMESLMKRMGTRWSFEYSGQVANGLLPYKVKRLVYKSGKGVVATKYADIDPFDFSFSKASQVISEEECTILKFEQIEDVEMNSLLEQFVMHQKELVEINTEVKE